MEDSGSTPDTVSTPAKYICGDCENTFDRKYSLNIHLITVHQKQPPELQTAIEGIFKVFSIIPEEHELKDLILFFDHVEPEVKRMLSHAGSVKWYLNLTVTFTKSTDPDVRQTSSFKSSTEVHLTTETSDVRDKLNCIREKIDGHVSSGSGWTLVNIDKLQLEYATYKPLSGYSFIETPRHLALKKAIINIKNKDEQCFKWHILASLHPAKSNPHRVSHYKRYEEELNFGDLKFPIRLCDISKFERLNNIAVSVFEYEKEVFPVRISREAYVRHVDLLLLKNEKTSHYCLIKNLGKLVSTTVTKHKGRLFFCRFCLQHFSSQPRLDTHLEMCSKHEIQKVSMPPREYKISFTNYKYMLLVPFVIYFDFECLVLPPSDDGRRKHEPCAYCFVVVKRDGRLYENQIHTYRGPDPVSQFLKSVLSKAKELCDLLIQNIPLNMTSKDEKDYKNAKKCALCKRPLGEDKVKDHCHLTGKYRGAVHSACNLALSKAKHIPIIAHNLQDYDGHLIMQKLGKLNLKVTCIPRTTEKYMSFSVELPNGVSLRFIDSLQFLNTSLDKCVQTATKSNWSFSILKSQFDDVSLLTRKGVFPYEYLDSWDKLNDTELPSLKSFYSSLTLENITDEDYKHAQKVWRTFEITNLGGYLDLYVKTDVLLLAEVFQFFRKTCYDNFQLDPAHFFTTPGLTWQAFLKKTKVELLPFNDIDMHLFIESGMRGGIASVGNIRYGRANIPGTPDFDSSKPPSSILYLDKNNLYGAALSEPMPKSDFRFLSKKEIDTFKLDIIPPNKGYILRVDLDYPRDLHDSHNMYPMAPEKIPITEDMISPVPIRKHVKVSTTVKLVPNLGNKRNYVCHYRNLLFYLKHGLRLVKVHTVLEFSEEPYIRPYIMLNTEKRRGAKTDFERDFYKLCNNSLYGKTLENVRKRVRVELTTRKRRATRLINSPSFKSFTIFDNDLVAVNSHFKKILLDKPIYIGFTVLELSKLFMYEFLYEKMLPVFGNRLNLLLTDTDSFVFHIESDHALRDIKTKLSEEFDLSNFPPDHFAYSEQNKGVVNKMKIEYPTRVIKEVVALRPKMYSILFEENDGEIKVAKGVTRAVTKHRLRHSTYKTTLESYKEVTESMARVQSSKHHIESIYYKKKTLSPFDDKRFYPDDKGIRSLAHYHYKVCPLGGGGGGC